VFCGFRLFSWLPCFRVPRRRGDWSGDGAESLRALRGSEGAERGLLSRDLGGGNGDRGKVEGAEGAESLNALRGVSPLKEGSVSSGFQ